MRRCGRPGRKQRKRNHDQNMLYEFSIENKNSQALVAPAPPAEEPGSALIPGPGV